MTDQVENQAAEETVQLSLQDIATMVQVIDICSKRGGFEGPELEAVGGLRNVYFANHDTLGAYTVDADGQLTDVAGTTNVFKYALNPQSSEYTETITVSEDNGTVFYEQVTTLMLPNLSKAALSALRLLTQGRFQIFTEDNNIIESKGFGNCYLVGAFFLLKQDRGRCLDLLDVS